MKRRTIFFLTLSLLIILALVQATLVSADGSTNEGECVNPETGEPCEDPGGGGDPPSPAPEEGCTPDPETGEGCGPDLGNPGNDKDVGKAGEKAEKHHFFYVEDWESGDPGDPIGTHGRSDPAKHKPHPSVQVPEE